MNANICLKCKHYTLSALKQCFQGIIKHNSITINSVIHDKTATLSFSHRPSESYKNCENSLANDLRPRPTGVLTMLPLVCWEGAKCLPKLPLAVHPSSHNEKSVPVLSVSGMRSVHLSGSFAPEPSPGALSQDAHSPPTTSGSAPESHCLLLTRFTDEVNCSRRRKLIEFRRCDFY